MFRANKIASSSLDPIKGYSHRGFIAGWCAIMLVGVAAFGLLVLPLGHTRADLEKAPADVLAIPAG